MKISERDCLNILLQVPYIVDEINIIPFEDRYETNINTVNPRPTTMGKNKLKRHRRKEQIANK